MSGREPWPEGHDRLLREMWAAGVPAKLIAHELGRTEGSVRSRRHQVGLEVRRHPDGLGRHRTENLRLQVSQDELDGTRRRARELGVSVAGYVRGLLMRDGAI